MKAFFAKAPAARRADLEALDAVIRKAAPRFEPYLAGKMLGYGRYRYRYESGREGESCRVGLAVTASGISLYVTAVDGDGEWLAEQAAESLGKVSVGKSCVRIKRLADVDLAALKKLIARAAKLKAPGEL